MPTTIYLMRHGATEANLAHPPRLQGRKQNLPLHRYGVAQAREARELLMGLPITACYTSPLRRATQTAEIITHGWNLRPVARPELVECDVGSWEGMDWQSIRYFDAAHYARFMADPLSHGYPRGERFLDVHERAQGAFQELLQNHEGESILVISHYAVNRVYLAGIEGLELDQQAIASLDSGEIAVVTHERGAVHYQSLLPRSAQRRAA